MASQEEIRDVRIQKLHILKDRGINPYPATAPHTHTLREITDSFDALSGGDDVTVVGRIMSIRGQGAIRFVDIFDGTAKFQIVFKKDVDLSYIGTDVDDAFELFGETADAGDFIACTGALFVTQKGQHSIEAHAWQMLTKSLLAIPTEHFGIKDDDDRFRKRYLDILLNPELRDLFDKKAKFWDVTRNFLKDRGFLEVETPTLEITTGGAEARPFKTHHNDFDLDVFLRISVGELWQKRLMAAGFPKVFEIGRVYRNEGSSLEHLQEFTNMEFYTAFTGVSEGKELVKSLYQTIAQDVFGTTKFETRGHTFDLADEWTEIDYVAHVKEVTGIDVLEADESAMAEKLHELGVTFEGENRERMTDSLWKYCRKKISGPAFLVNHPKLVAPLSKDLEGQPGKTDMFQVIIAGSEIGRAHAELNDPLEQAERFKVQQALIDAGDDEAMMEDKEFVEMLEYGMPPTFGFGFGERFFAFLIDKPIRETQLFPLMRPRD